MSTKSIMFDDKSISSESCCQETDAVAHTRHGIHKEHEHALKVFVLFTLQTHHTRTGEKPTHLHHAIVRLARFRGRGAPREVYNIVHVFSSEATQRSIGRHFLCSLSSCTRVGFTFPGDNVPQGKRSAETCGCPKCLKVARGGDAGGCIDAAQYCFLSSEDF